MDKTSRTLKSSCSSRNEGCGSCLVSHKRQHKQKTKKVRSASHPASPSLFANSANCRLHLAPPSPLGFCTFSLGSRLGPLAASTLAKGTTSQRKERKVFERATSASRPPGPVREDVFRKYLR